jgi:hypothetical protein
MYARSQVIFRSRILRNDKRRSPVDFLEEKDAPIQQVPKKKLILQDAIQISDPMKISALAAVVKGSELVLLGILFLTFGMIAPKRRHVV